VLDRKSEKKLGKIGRMYEKTRSRPDILGEGEDQGGEGKAVRGEGGHGKPSPHAEKKV